jgi:hypothetical protein
MNMISTGTFLNGMDASNKQSELVKKLVTAWEKKNSKAARAGGVSLMALSLAACGGEDTTPFAQSDIDAATAPLVAAAAAAAIVADAALAAAQADAAGALVAQVTAETQAATALVAQATAEANAAGLTVTAAAATAASATATASAAAATVAQAAAEAAQATAEAALATAQAALTTANAEKATLQTTYNDLVTANNALQVKYNDTQAPKLADDLKATNSATADNIIGGAGNDPFSGAVGTVAAGDRFTDVSTTDSDTLTIVHSTAPGAFTSTNIEAIDITLNGLGALAVDLANVTGTNTLTITRGDVIIGASTLTGNKTVVVNNLDSSQVGSVTVGAATTTVDINSAATDTAGHVLNLDTATGAITVDGAATINAALSSQVDIDGAAHVASRGLASEINAASATTVTSHANLTGAVTINAAKGTTVTVNDAQGGATVNAATAHTADATVTVVDIDSSGATVTVGTGVDDTATASNIGLDVTLDGGAATTDAATVSGAGHIELSIAGTGAQGNVDIITLSGNGAGVVYDLAAPTTGTAVSFTKAGDQSVEIMGDLSEFDAITVTNIDVIDIISGGGATLNASLFSGVGKIDLGVAAGNNAMTVNSGQTIEITADQTTTTNFDFSAAGGGDLTIVAGDDNGASAAVGTINFVAFNAAAAAATTVGNVTVEASISNIDMEGATVGAAQNLIITGDEDVNLADRATAETVTADSLDASGSSGIITLNVEDNSGVATVDNITTGSGNDLMTIDGTAVMTVSSGAGNDTITITDADATSTFNAGAGNDTIDVDEVAQVVVLGGAGNDNFTTAVAIGGTIVGGDGTDTITIDADANVTFAATFAMSGISELDITAVTTKTVQMTGAQLAGNSTLILDGNAAGDTFDVETASTATVARSADLSNVTVKTGATVSITVTGNVGADTITGGVASESFTHTIGVDTIEGGAGTGVDTFTTVNTLTAAGSSNASVGTLVNMGGSAVTQGSVNSNASSFISGSITSVAAGKVALLYAGNVVGNSAELDTIGGVENITGSAGIDYIVGSGENNTITTLGGADYIEGGAGIDTITGGAGIDTILLGLSDAVADTVSLTGVVAAVNRDTISDFVSGIDKLGLDVDNTTVTTAAGAATSHEAIAITQLTSAGAYRLDSAATKTTAAADIFELTAGNTTTADLSAATDGAELFKLLGTAGQAATSITIDNNGDDFFISAVDGGNAFIYAIVGDAGDKSVEADDIALVATLNGVTDVAAADFTMVA